MKVSPFPSRLLVPPHAGENLQLTLLGLMVFSGAFVVVDVAYNAMSLIALGLFLLMGLRLDWRNVPLILFLVVFNLAGLVALLLMFADWMISSAVEFILGFGR